MRNLWPEVDAYCTSNPISFQDYLESIDDHYRFLDFPVGDLSRILVYPKHGFAIEQDGPEQVMAATVGSSTPDTPHASLPEIDPMSPYS